MLQECGDTTGQFYFTPPLGDITSDNMSQSQTTLPKIQNGTGTTIRRRLKLKIQKQEYFLHPRGMFNAKVKEVVEGGEGQFGPYISIVFQTPEGSIWDRCSAKITEGSNLTKRICSILNTTFQQIPDDFDTDDLVGHVCSVFVDHVQKDEMTYANVDNVIPFEESGNDGRQPQRPLSDDYQVDDTEVAIPF